MELRTALADYLSRARGVHAEPERIVICAGFQHGLTLTARALRHGACGRRRRVVRPGPLPRPADRRRPAHPAAPVDEHGARTDELAALSGVGAVLLTPAHQFPTGVALHPDRRAAAVDWARAPAG